MSSLNHNQKINPKLLNFEEVINIKIKNEEHANEIFDEMVKKDSQNITDWIEISYALMNFQEVVSEEKKKPLIGLGKALDINRKESISQIIKNLGITFKENRKKFANDLNFLQKLIAVKIKYTEEALELCDWGIKINSQDKFSWLNKGWCLITLSRRRPQRDDAIEFKDGKLVLHVPDPRQQVHFKHEGRRCFEQALQIDPDFEAAKDAIDLWDKTQNMHMSIGY